MKLNNNISATIALNALKITEGKLSSSTERLSSGYKINHAKDNPSGLAIAKRMKAQLRGLSNASQNASDGISVVQTAEGALSEMQEIIQRMSELAVKGATGSITDGDRGNIEDEIVQLKDELERISRDTDFNGQRLLNGECDLKGYTDAEGVNVSYYSDEVDLGLYTLTAVTPTFDADNNLQPGSITLLQDGSETAFPAGTTITYEEDRAIITGPDSFEIQLKISDVVTPSSGDGSVTLDISGIGAMRMQIGANEGQVLPIRIPTVSLETLGISRADYSNQAGCNEAITMTAKASSYISSIRSRIGAYENRLEHTANSLDVSNENVTAAYARMMDTDMAAEMAEYTSDEILSQAGVSVLAQANERPQMVLQLLQ